MASTYVVTAALVIVRDETGASHYHYQAAMLPSYVSTADIKRLVAEGLIAKAPDEPFVVAPPADNPDGPAVLVTPTAPTASTTATPLPMTKARAGTSS